MLTQASYLAVEFHSLKNISLSFEKTRKRHIIILCKKYIQDNFTYSDSNRSSDSRFAFPSQPSYVYSPSHVTTFPEDAFVLPFSCDTLASPDRCPRPEAIKSYIFTRYCFENIILEIE